MPLQRPVVRRVQAIEEIGPAELPPVRATHPVPAQGAAITTLDIGKRGGKAKGRAPGAVRHKTRHQDGIPRQVIDEKSIPSRGQPHIDEEDDPLIVPASGCRSCSQEFP